MSDMISSLPKQLHPRVDTGLFHARQVQHQKSQLFIAFFDHLLLSQPQRWEMMGKPWQTAGDWDVVLGLMENYRGSLPKSIG